MLRINIKFKDDQRDLGEVLDMMYNQLVGIKAYIDCNIVLIDDPENNEIALTIDRGDSLDRCVLDVELKDIIYTPPQMIER